MLGDRIKQLRDDIYINEKQLARVLGKSKRCISDYENNISQPDAKTLQRLSDFFEVPVDYLINGSKLRRHFENDFNVDLKEDEAGRLAGEILDSVEVSVKDAAVQKNVELLKIVDRVYKSIREVKITEKPEGKIIINDELNGVYLVLSNSSQCSLDNRA